MAGHQVASTTALIDGFRDLIRAPLDDLLARQIMAAAGPGHIKDAVVAGDRRRLLMALQCYFTKRTALAIGRREPAAEVVRGAESQGSETNWTLLCQLSAATQLH